MNSFKLKKLISKFHDEAFAFAFVLIPDDLQAGQIVIDATEILMVQEESLMEDLFLAEKEEEREVEIRLRDHLFKKIYTLGYRRYPQVQISITDTRIAENPYFQFTLIERAVLFFKYRLKMDISSISDILEMKRYDVIGIIGKARNTIFNQSVSTNV